MIFRTKARGADALARALEAAGVKRIFTLSGNHIMSVFDALLDSGIELVHTRHEGTAVHMADAWARLTGMPGVALVTGGPGHANAVSALYTRKCRNPPYYCSRDTRQMTNSARGRSAKSVRRRWRCR